MAIFILAVKKVNMLKGPSNRKWTTGRAVGAHLHYEIKVHGKAVNPYTFISKGRNLLSSTTFKR